MTIVLNSVAAGMIGGPKVLAFPKQLVSIPLSNYYNHNNNNNYIRFFSGLSTNRSRSVLSSTSNQLSYRSWYTFNCLEEEKDCNPSARLEEEEDYNDSNNGRTRSLSYDRMDGSSSSSRSCSCNCNNNNENNSFANTSPSSYDRMDGSSSSRSRCCNFNNNNENNSIANTSPSSYDRMGGSSSSLSLSSSTRSCCCNCQNSSPSIHINIVFPSAASTIAMLSHVYSKVYPLLDQLMLFVQDKSLFFFQVAVSDKERGLLRKLNKISENANTSTSDGLNCVFKEVIKALLQFNDSSIHFTMLNTYYGSWKSLSKEYKDLLSRELESHDHVEYKNEGSMVKANSSIENEYTVVTLLVLATGQYLIPNFKGTGARYHECLEQLQEWGDRGRCYDFFEVLRTLERIPKNELHSVEVLWSPRKEDKVLLEDELLRDFPRLVRIENGLMYGDVNA